MKAFANMIRELGNTHSIHEKTNLLSAYFTEASDTDKLWTLSILAGKKPPKTIRSSDLKKWCMEYTGMQPWLFEESYQHVGDLAETIALLLPTQEGIEDQPETSLSEILKQLYHNENKEEDAQKRLTLSYWKHLPPSSCFVFNKLITGGFRMGVSKNILIQAIAKAENKNAADIAYRLTGAIDPFTDSYQQLIHGTVLENPSKPYPFYLSHPIDVELTQLDPPEDWLAEWKWDGIRGQCIKRKDRFFIWSRGEHLITESIPEFEPFLRELPDGTVLDGEIIGAIPEAAHIAPLPFSLLQNRINRKRVSKKMMQEIPLLFIAYDILEHEGTDIRNKPLQERKEILHSIISHVRNKHLRFSPLLTFQHWETLTGLRKSARAQAAEGLMLKKKNSAYLSGRKRGEWWKWKIDPLTIDCVLLYAQKGHGRRSNLFTDYTFAVKEGDKFVTFTKAYSGLTDAEFKEVDQFIKKNAVEKFGPVRTVKPVLVFEIAFEGISESKRHKSGVALRFPRMKQIRRDKSAEEINTLEDLKQMLEIYRNQPPLRESL